MSDKELLEAAAWAAGRLRPHGNADLLRSSEELRYDGNKPWFWPAGDSWNPLADDGDALRLAVKLGIRLQCVEMDHAEVDMGSDTDPMFWQAVSSDYDPYAATRRAIVRAAAKLGEHK